MLMFTPGPTEVHPRVLQAMARPLQNPDLDSDFFTFYDALCESLTDLGFKNSTEEAIKTLKEHL